jgi:hypothetical protein
METTLIYAAVRLFCLGRVAYARYAEHPYVIRHGKNVPYGLLSSGVRLHAEPYGSKFQGMRCEQYVFHCGRTVINPMAMGKGAFGRIAADDDGKGGLKEHLAVRVSLGNGVELAPVVDYNEVPWSAIAGARRGTGALQKHIDLLFFYSLGLVSADAPAA